MIGRSENVASSSYMAFETWIAGLEARHLADLTFPEVSRALRALSSTYVERREQIRHGAALSGAGKRAAFALFYGPLHYMVVRHIVASLDAAREMPRTLLDLGCGTGAAGAAWAAASATPPQVVGVDLNRWAVEEASRTYREFGLSSRTRMTSIERVDFPHGRAAIVAAYALNELIEAERARVTTTLFERAAAGDRVLIVEPLAGFVAPWWNACADRAREAGGRVDEWRFRAELPPIVAKLDRAAGLRHGELTARSIFL